MSARAVLVLSAAALLVGCSARIHADFDDPQDSLRQTVSLCGEVVDDGNFVIDRSHPVGLSLVELGPLDPSFRGPACLQGTVTYVGCASGPQMCLGWSHDYGLQVTGVRYPQRARP